MQTWIGHFYPIIAIGLFMAMPLVAIYIIAEFIIRRRRKKSIWPLTKGLLRGPGHSVRQEYEKRIEECIPWIAVIMMLSLWPFTSTGLRVLFDQPVRFTQDVVITIGLMTYVIFKLVSLASKARPLRLGMEAEIACGQELSQLMRHGWYVFHDVPDDKAETTFNIDHILIGPSGVYAIETKGRRKPLTRDGQKQYEAMYQDGYIQFPHGKDRKTIEQAQRGARYVSEWLSKACGFKIDAIPALLFPGWYFKKNSSRPPFPLGNPQGVMAYIQNNPNKLYSEKQCAQIAYHVERTVRLPSNIDGNKG